MTPAQQEEWDEMEQMSRENGNKMFLDAARPFILAELEQHTRGEKGIWIPIGLWQLYETEALNAEEMVLLSQIDALDKSERGCWASNQWLAEWWKKSRSQVSRAISKFIELGLVEQVVKKLGNNKSQRHLHVTFNISVPKAMSDTIRKNAEATQKCASTIRKNAQAPYAKMRIKYSNRSNKEKTHCAPSAQSEFFLKVAADKLSRFLLEQKALPKDTKQADIQKKLGWLLRKDLNNDQARLKRVIQIYTTERHTEFTPSVFSVFDFRQKFLKIEKWVNKQHPLPPEPQYDVKIVERIIHR